MSLLGLYDIILANATAIRSWSIALGATAGAVKLIVAIRGWRRDLAAVRLERELAESAGVAAYTKAEIDNACRNYIEPSCTSTDPSEEDDLRNVVALAPLFETVDRHLQSGGERRHIILLADSGMGKTSFCINYYAREKAKKATDRKRVAIVPLGSGDPIAQIASLSRESETVLFLDAFDEDPEAVTDPHTRLRALMAAASRFRNVVITCRSQFFESDERIPRGSGIMYAASRRAGVSREFPLHKLFLAPLSKKQIERYIAKCFSFSSFGNLALRRLAIRMVDTIPELSVRPMLLELIPGLVRENRSIEQLFGLYEYLVESWFKREKDWIDEADLQAISIEFALQLFLRQRRGLGDRMPPHELENIATAHNSSIATWKLKSRSLLNRDTEGNFKFAHRSIMEYLVVVGALNGDPRGISVEWTDHMKDLLVSLANSDNNSEALSLELLDRDLSEAKILPLGTGLAVPRRLSASECRRILKNDDVSVRNSRRIPVAWRNRNYAVRCLADAGSVKSFLIDDKTNGILWLITDISLVFDSSERDLYLDRFSDAAPADAKVRGFFGPRLNPVYRHPSLEELITLWQSESYLCDKAGVHRIFDGASIYWVGDRLEENNICCSFGATPHVKPELKLLDSKAGVGGSKLFVYELLGRYGMVNRSHYRALCAYIIDDSPPE